MTFTDVMHNFTQAAERSQHSVWYCEEQNSNVNDGIINNCNVNNSSLRLQTILMLSILHLDPTQRTGYQRVNVDDFIVG